MGTLILTSLPRKGIDPFPRHFLWCWKIGLAPPFLGIPRFSCQSSLPIATNRLASKMFAAAGQRHQRRRAAAPSQPRGLRVRPRSFRESDVSEKLLPPKNKNTDRVCLEKGGTPPLLPGFTKHFGGPNEKRHVFRPSGKLQNPRGPSLARGLWIKATRRQWLLGISPPNASEKNAHAFLSFHPKSTSNPTQINPHLTLTLIQPEADPGTVLPEIKQTPS